MILYEAQIVLVLSKGLTEKLKHFHFLKNYLCSFLPPTYWIKKYKFEVKRSKMPIILLLYSLKCWSYIVQNGIFCFVQNNN